jgi:hypothetical protein
MKQSDAVDATLQCTSPEEYSPPPRMSAEKRFLDSSRPEVTITSTSSSESSPSLTSREECCHACAAEPLCLAWTLSAGTSCHLHTRFEREPSQHLLAEAEFDHDHDHDQSTASSFSAVMKPRRFYPPRAVIFHGTMCGYQNLSITEQKRDINNIYIGRYMFERDSRGLYKSMTPEENTVFLCLLRMDEVWVPTEWMKTELEMLSQMMGYRFPVMAVIPEAVDTTLFDPANTHLEPPAATAPYQFVSIFKWEDRKGWDVLLKAYWTAFSADDDVVLRLHTYRPSFLASQGQVNITENLIRFAQATFGKDLSQLARVSIGDERQSTDHINSCDDEVCTTNDGGHSLTATSEGKGIQFF